MLNRRPTAATLLGSTTSATVDRQMECAGVPELLWLHASKNTKFGRRDPDRTELFKSDSKQTGFANHVR